MSDSSFLANNREKINFDSNILFDRVINLKLITGKPNAKGVVEQNNEFVIRSDFEAVYPNKDVRNAFRKGNIDTNSYFFRKCQHKPSIKVQYKQVSGGTSTELDVFISNFFLMDKDGNTIQTFSNKDNPLIQVEIMMGYFGQFQKAFNVDSATMNDYFDLTPVADIDKIVMRNVEYVTMDKLPPDSTLHIHGYVGNIVEASLDKNNKTNTFSAVEASEVTMELQDKTYKEIFDSLITKRFLRQGAVNKIKGSKDAETATQLVLKDGLMSDADAKKYGIQVVMSEELKELKVEAKEDGEGGKANVKICIPAGSTSIQAMNLICSQIDPRIEWKLRNNGNFFVYLHSELENPEKLSETANGDTVNAFSTRKGVLPAVTNINISAISTIVCPYFGFLEPFQYFYFVTRYALSNIVSYYASIDSRAYKFYALSLSVSFATVDDINEMTIRACTEEEEVKNGK